MTDTNTDLEPLLRTLVETIPAPEGDMEAPLQIMVTTLDYDEYVGKIAIGRIVRGFVRAGQAVAIMNGDRVRQDKISRLYTYTGLKRLETNDAHMGDIVAITGFEDINIGETVRIGTSGGVRRPLILTNRRWRWCSRSTFPLCRQGRGIHHEPPFAGALAERSADECRHASGRSRIRRCLQGVRPRRLHLSILIETMRREGYELQVGKPTVIMRRSTGSCANRWNV